jgi:hypothetical protein
MELEGIKYFKPSKQYTTHMPVLIKLVQATDGPVLELGSGLFSTPLLHWLCAENGRKLVTYEEHPQWYKIARRFTAKNHSVRLVTDWDKLDLGNNWSVVFIDHDGPPYDPYGRRKIDALRLKDRADYLVIHDTQEPAFDYDKRFWSYFKYRYDWKFCTPNTTIVSNRKELSWIK